MLDQKVLLSSGGMDSFLLAHEPELKGAIHVFVNIRQKYLDKEVAAAEKVARLANARFTVVRSLDMSIYEHESGIIPFRNAELILCAAQKGNQIYLGVIADEINSDKSVEFCTAMEQVLNISHRQQYWTEGVNYSIRTPFRDFSKTKLLERYLAGGGRLERVLQSVSCYDAGAMHCGRCASCFKRWVALTNVVGRNKWQQWGYVADPYTWQTMGWWEVKFSEYDIGRAEEISRAFWNAAQMT